MDDFRYRSGELHCEGVSLESIAREVGTPVYVYGAATLVAHYRKLRDAFAALRPTICYSVKSLANVNLLKLLVAEGSGMDVVSGGELHRALAAGCDPRKIVYAGVGKTDAEVLQAIDADIGAFNVESEAEFENTAQLCAARGKRVRAALRINPDVADARTHAKTTTGKKETKFGVDLDAAEAFFDRFGRDAHLKLDALHLHIGSPIYSPEPYVAAIDKTLALIDRLRARGFRIDALDLGGGFAADYETDASPGYDAYAAAIVPLLQPFVDGGGHVYLEPGRTISANSGVLATRVLYTKTGGSKRFAICDAGMNALIRPALYDAWMFQWPAHVAPEHVPAGRLKEMPNAGLVTYDVVGPVCETGDHLARGRALPPLARGDLMCVFGAGAYGMAMASNYNALPRPAEVLVEGDRFRVIRRRETYDDLVAHELGA